MICDLRSEFPIGNSLRRSHIIFIYIRSSYMNHFIYYTSTIKLFATKSLNGKHYKIYDVRGQQCTVTRSVNVDRPDCHPSKSLLRYFTNHLLNDWPLRKPVIFVSLESQCSPWLCLWKHRGSWETKLTISLGTRNVNYYIQFVPLYYPEVMCKHIKILLVCCL